MNKLVEMYCPHCGMMKSYATFHRHIRDGYSWMPYCKNCINLMLKSYIKATKSDAGGLWCLLAEVGIPFKQKAWNVTKKAMQESMGKGGAKPNLFTTYVKVLMSYDEKINGFWESDVMLNELIEIEKPIFEVVDTTMDLNKEARIWGHFTSDEYTFLNDTFEQYTKNLTEMDANEVNRYRDLCKAELRKRKADEKGDIQEIAKAQDNLKKMLEMLKLTDFTKVKKTDEERAYERVVAIIENSTPAECEDLTKYMDMVGYEKQKALCMRSLTNAIAGTREYPDIPIEER